MTRVSLFLSSYTLLFAMLAIRWHSTVVLVPCIVITILGGCATVWLLRGELRKAPISVQVVSVMDRSGEVPAYLLGYLLPLISVNQPSRTDFVLYALFVVVLGIVTWHLGPVVTNPLLAVFGIRVFEIDTGAGRPRYLLARNPPVAKTNVTATRVLNDIFLEAHVDGRLAA